MVDTSWFELDDDTQLLLSLYILATAGSLFLLCLLVCTTGSRVKAVKRCQIVIRLLLIPLVPSLVALGIAHGIRADFVVFPQYSAARPLVNIVACVAGSLASTHFILRDTFFVGQAVFILADSFSSQEWLRQLRCLDDGTCADQGLPRRFIEMLYYRDLAGLCVGTVCLVMVAYMCATAGVCRNRYSSKVFSTTAPPPRLSDLMKEQRKEEEARKAASASSNVPTSSSTRKRTTVAPM
mmetsp:Transcript_27393/g.88032  ORF Transcript_27393/g.88032 Transcript_27393/m.88032 type:complete len:238 (+) Transcript_27393:1097-1810(+)|eukprot:CAMPEP_0196770624 /NCGR_PEP_ID=MMETSP1104-20130614/1245_1 /TAXON_ID=33652 /ORGANISM="Cafeteria sp., Strain Caron Lab Isolate" /LENGTH=237 /DNA_ID=CAMNT_0042140741 /DNA_START=80 /DNA_END=793 /DNA_ORIENTATION=+